MNKLFIFSVFCLVLSLSYGKLYLNKFVKENQKQTLINWVETQQNVLNISTSADDIVISSSHISPSLLQNRVMKSGYLLVNKGSQSNSAVFYTFYGAINVTSQQEQLSRPLLIWLQGGPGGASQFGNLVELGPFQLVFKDGSSSEREEAIRENSWAEQYNILCIDQPIGVGGSYAQTVDEIPQTLQHAAQHFYNALIELYNLQFFQQYKNTPLYITGESYAGKYVPAFASEILRQNQQASFQIPLTGIAIVDGFTNPRALVEDYPEYFYNLGLISFQQKADAEVQKQQLLNSIDNGQWQSAHDQFDNLFGLLSQQAGGINAYDYREYSDPTNGITEPFFASSANKQRYNMNPNIQYQDISETVYNAMYLDFMRPAVDDLEYVLSQNIQVLVFQGQDDAIVTTPGIERHLQNVTFNGDSNFRSQGFTQILDQNQQVVGQMKKSNNLEFAVVNKAGHMVPFYELNTSVIVLNNWINSHQKAEQVKQAEIKFLQK